MDFKIKFILSSVWFSRSVQATSYGRHSRDTGLCCCLWRDMSCCRITLGSLFPMFTKNLFIILSLSISVNSFGRIIWLTRSFHLLTCTQHTFCSSWRTEWGKGSRRIMFFLWSIPVSAIGMTWWFCCLIC